jgi:CCR4-NOT transcription complex subunit 6
MEMGQFEDFFQEQLHQHAEYKGVYFAKSRQRLMNNEYDRRQVDGCATLYKSQKYK